jgi:hypothetical protein
MTASVAENLKQTESRFADQNEGLFQHYRPNADIAGSSLIETKEAANRRPRDVLG